MVLNCCVPFCTTKTYQHNDDKVSHYQFPNSNTKEGLLLRQKWIQAIRRDVGRHFAIDNRHTKVCSQHFKPNDFCKTLAGLRKLKPGAVPSIFHWKQDSPKRKAPKERKLSSPKKRKTCVDNEPVENKQVEENKEVGCQTDISQNMIDQLYENASLFKEERLKLVENTNTLQEKTNELQEKTNELQEANQLLHEKVNKLQEHANILSAELKQKEKHCSDVKKELECIIQKCADSEKRCKRVFELEKFLVMDNNEAMNFYTGFPSIEVFESVFTFLNPGDNGENIRYKSSASNAYIDAPIETPIENSGKPGKPRALKPKEEFFLTLCRLRQGFAEEHISHLYGIHQSTVSRIVSSWINFMFLKFSKISIWPSRELVDKHMPEAFREKYPNTKVIIDCTEIKCQMPSSLLLNSQLYSSYKNHTTLKGLIGITPGGCISFISELYTGRISDREIVERSGFLEQSFDIGDSVMADKGFLIQALLPPGVYLNMPPFLGEQVQFSANDTIGTQSIASLRVHVERAINKIKNFHIWERIIPINLFGTVNQMWTVCAFLCNLQNPIISA